MMQNIKNSAGRLVCRANKRTREVEIYIKGCTTVVGWTQDGRLKIVNTKIDNTRK